MLADLLQANRGAPGNAPPAGLFAFLIVFYGGLCVFSVAVFVMQIFLYITLMKTLEQVSPRNRKMEPGLVWLNLVPFLNLVWIFLTVLRVAESLRDEFDDRGLRDPEGGDYGQTLGLVHAVGTIVCGVSAIVTIPLYRAKIGRYRAELERGESGRGSGRRDRDDRRDELDDDDRA